MTKKENPGYHINEIPRGIYGEFSKVEEEFAEVEDSLEQRCAIMTLVELSDLFGAMEAYYGEENFASYMVQSAKIMCAVSDYDLNLEEFIVAGFRKLQANPDDPKTIVHFLALTEMLIEAFNLNSDDVMEMNRITKRAFRAGRRVPNN